MLAYRAAMRKVPRGVSLVDESDRGPAVRVLWSDVAAGEERDPKRLQKPWCDADEAGVVRLRHRLASRDDGFTPRRPVERRVSRDACRSDAIDAAHDVGQTGRWRSHIALQIDDEHVL